MLGVTNSGSDLRKLFDSVSDLLIEDTTICDDDNGIEHGLVVFRETYELMSQPCDRV